MSVRRIDQAMAEAAADMLPGTVDPDLRTRYRQLQSMLHRAGLAATYAFVAARSRDKQHGLAYAQVAQGIRLRLRDRHLLPDLAPDASHAQVLKELGKLTAGEYARTSQEITTLVGWLSRLADASVVAEQPPHPGDGAGNAHTDGEAS